MRRKTWLLPVIMLPGLLAADKSLRLPIGDPARRDREAKVVLDAITDTATGELITPLELAKRLAAYRIVFLGESHTSMDFHIVQCRVIEEVSRLGKKVFVGLEMYPYTEQAHLDQWCQGLLTEAGFVQLSRWYKNWGYHWNYYREIFSLVRQKGMRVFAVNTPREVVSAVRKKGFKDLTPEEARHIPAQIETSHAEHFALFKALFEDEEGIHSAMDEKQWRAMFEAQCTWDATMSFNAVRALKDHGDENTIMVVLIGSGHVAYGLGIQRQAAQWFDGPMASVIPIRVVDGKDRPVEAVQASYANYIWGLPPEKDPVYPDLGIATGDIPGDPRRKVLSVGKNSLGNQAGFLVGDILISMDGKPISDRETFNRLMSEMRWGDRATIVVRRGETQVSLRVDFRRKVPVGRAAK